MVGVNRRYPSRSNSLRGTESAVSIGLIKNAGPLLLALFAGGLFFVRGCMSARSNMLNVPPMSFPQVSAPAIQSAEHFSPIPRRTTNQNISRERDQAIDFLQESTVHSESAAMAKSLLEADNSLNETGAIDQVRPVYEPLPMPFFGGPGATLPFGQMPGRFTESSQAPFVSGIISGTSPGLQSTIEECPLFDSKRGRKFLGICQMPGEPSKRASLSIGAIKDNGRNIQCRLVLLDPPRNSKSFEGCIDPNQQTLTLLPVANPKSFGTFLTHMPWYSNSPTRITLRIDAEGKLLCGSSVSGEEFEFVPQIDRAQVAAAKRDTKSGAFSGFDDPSRGATTWKLRHRNGSPFPDSTTPCWTFGCISDATGSFTWTEGERTIAAGTYREDSESGFLDLVIARGTEPRTYPGRYQVSEGGDNIVDICVAKQHDAARPARISSELGNVYQIELQAKEKR